MIDELVSAARRAVAERRERVPLTELERRLDRSRRRDFRAALRVPGLSFIAEFKRRSPSAGPIAEDAVLAEQVRAYERGGAAALSILTEEAHFGGSLSDLASAREATELPLLRKDFVVDEYQLFEAAASGADAVLLIVRALSQAELTGLRLRAADLGLGCLVEVHERGELDSALEAGAELIGINNRDLDGGEVDQSTALGLLPDLPKGTTSVAESGISSSAQLAELERAGADAVLVGTELMRARDPAQRLRELRGVPAHR